MKVVTNTECLGDEFVPLLLQVFSLVKLITVHLEGVLDQGVHVRDWLELEVDVGLLFADLLEGKHDATNRVDVLHLLVDLQTDLFDVIGKVGEKVLCLLVDILREYVLPAAEVVVESSLNTLSFERKSTNLVSLLNLIDLSALLIEVLELLFEVIKVRVVISELL